MRSSVTPEMCSGETTRRTKGHALGYLQARTSNMVATAWPLIAGNEPDETIRATDRRVMFFSAHPLHRAPLASSDLIPETPSESRPRDRRLGPSEALERIRNALNRDLPLPPPS